MEFYTTSELSHHGILGMKWGVRRYQNPDGTLTEAGKKRYYTDNGYLSEKGKKYNEEKQQRGNRIAKAVLYNTKETNKEFSNKLNEYRTIWEKNDQEFRSNRNKYRGPKGEDKFYSREDSKKEAELRQELYEVLKESVKEHPLSDKKMRQLSYVVFNESVNPVDDKVTYGKYAVDKIMRDYLNKE